MDAVDAIYGRRAIRNFAEAVPPREEVQALIEAAVQAPSGMNRQPWAFVAASGRPLLADWSARSKRFLLDTLPQSDLPQGLREPLASAGFNIFYNAPLLVVVCATDAEPMSMKDCCLAAQNLMLAAYDRGMGSCWIGLSEGWLGSPQGRAALGLPQDWVPAAPIILGRPAETPERPHRNPPQVRWLETAAA